MSVPMGQTLICNVFVLSDGYLAVYIIIFYLSFKLAEEVKVVENSAMNNSTGILSDEDLAALDLFSEYSSALLDFGAISCVIFMMIGIPGNLLTIVSLALYKKIRNATAIFIINLSLADLLFGCINLPFAISTFLTRKWLHGVVMCEFFVFARFVLSGVALSTVLAITINRYIMIFHPLLYTKLYSSRNLGFHVAFTWIGSIACMTTTWTGVWGRFGMDLKSSFCMIQPDIRGNSPMATYFVCAFIIPFLVISICYGRIFFLVRKTTAKARCNAPSVNNNNDISFATSTGERSQSRPDIEHDKVQQPLNPPSHPRVQSLRPPYNTGLNTRVTIASESSSSVSRISNFARSIKLRKSQILNIAPTSKDKKLLTMITAIMFTFLVFHLPITIMKVCANIIEFNPRATICCYLLRYLTTCINPIIYVLMSHEYRKAYKKLSVLLTCKKSCLPI